MAYAQAAIYSIPTRWSEMIDMHNFFKAAVCAKQNVFFYFGFVLFAKQRQTLGILNVF